MMRVLRSWASCKEILSTRGLPCLAVEGRIAECPMSRSEALRSHSSMGLNPVSLLTRSLSDRHFPAPAISVLICSSVGNFGICLVFPS